MIHELYNSSQVRVEDISYISELHGGYFGFSFKIIFKSGAEIHSSLKIVSVDRENFEIYSNNRIMNKLLSQKIGEDCPEKTNLYYDSLNPDLKEKIVNGDVRSLSFAKRFQQNYNELVAKLKEI